MGSEIEFRIYWEHADRIVCLQTPPSPCPFHIAAFPAARPWIQHQLRGKGGPIHWPTNRSPASYTWQAGRAVLWALQRKTTGPNERRERERGLKPAIRTNPSTVIMCQRSLKQQQKGPVRSTAGKWWDAAGLCTALPLATISTESGLMCGVSACRAPRRERQWSPHTATAREALDPRGAHLSSATEADSGTGKECVRS